MIWWLIIPKLWCWLWGILTHAGRTTCYHNFNSMWTLPLGRRASWTCATVTLLMLSVLVHTHSLILQITTLSVYFRSTSRNWNVISHRTIAPHSGGDTITHLKGSLTCTECFSSFTDCVFDGNLSERVTAITDYINFRINTSIPFKTIKTYPISKPEKTPQIKQAWRKNTKPSGSKTRQASKWQTEQYKMRFLRQNWNLSKN